MPEEHDKPLDNTPERSQPDLGHPIEEAVVEGDIQSGDSGHKNLARITFQGPLPPPDMLQGYKEIQADFPERILRLTEEEALHRRKVTSRAVRSEAAQALIGQVFGLVVALAAFATSALLGYYGHPTAASVVGGGTIVGLVTVFIQGRRYTGKDDQNDNQ